MGIRPGPTAKLGPGRHHGTTGHLTRDGPAAQQSLLSEVLGPAFPASPSANPHHMPIAHRSRKTLPQEGRREAARCLGLRLHHAVKRGHWLRGPWTLTYNTSPQWGIACSCCRGSPAVCPGAPSLPQSRVCSRF